MITFSSLLQLFRYGIVGLLSNGLGYSIFLYLTYLEVGPKQAMSLLYFASMGISYWGNWRWTFMQNGNFLNTSGRFLLTHLFGYLLNCVLLLLFVDVWGYPYQVVQALAIITVAFFIYIAFKFFVFTTTQVEVMDEKMS